MAKITFILGLCASGKSYLAEKIVEETGAYLLDEGFTPKVSQYDSEHRKIVSELLSGRDCVITEIDLYYEDSRNQVVERLQRDVPNLEIEWICIEKDIEQASWNNRYRIAKGEKGNRGHEEINATVSSCDCPVGSTQVKMFRPIVHNMNLNDLPFENIKEGKKSVELRLFDEKRQKINIGDVVVFSNGDSKIETVVIGLSRFSKFSDLFKAIGGVSAGWNETDTPEKMATDMRKYYSEEEEKKHGVVGIHISVIKEDYSES